MSSSARRRWCALLLVCLALLAVAACGDDDDDSGTGDLTVLAAASLTDVFPEIDGAPSYSFEASDTLATQIREGAPADVYAAANTRLPNELHDEGLVDEPQVFATNRLVLLVPKGNPNGITGVQDLAGGDVTYVMAAEGVPVGDYTREVLANLNAENLVAGAASFEDDVRSVTSKVALGEADAGFAYATDAQAVADDVEAVELPASAQVPIEYGIAVVSATENDDAAQTFVDEVLGPDGRAALETAGFGLP